MFQNTRRGGIANSVLLLAAMFQGIDEIAYSELSTEKKSQNDLDVKRCYYFGKEQNSNMFKIFNHVSKCR